MTAAAASVTDIIAELERKRFWRERCGEPMPNFYPVRCQRNLGHADGHVGIGARIVSAYGEDPVRWEPTYVTWAGVGNSISAHTGNYKCWCNLTVEQLLPRWMYAEYPQRTT